jgi:hypothetical protein
MAHPYHHSLSSVRKWGGSPFDYLPLHSWFDLMWTGKSFFSRYSAKVVVPVVHRRGGAGGPTGATRSASVWISAAVVSGPSLRCVGATGLRRKLTSYVKTSLSARTGSGDHDAVP